MKKINFIVLTCVLVLAIFSSFAFAEDSADKTVTVIGEGVIFNKDQATAEQKAVENALRSAVERVVGVYIKSSTLVENFVTIDDKILSQSKGYVKTYKKISSKVQDGTVIVNLEVTVATVKLKGAIDELQAALSKKDFPRVMFLIAEQNVGKKGFSSMGHVENTLIQVLGEKGFTFIDAEVVAGKISQNDAYQANGTVSNQTAKEIANLTDAEIIIIGKAVSTDAGTIMGTKLHSGQADITVRVINTDNGQILFSANSHGAGQNVSTNTAGEWALIDAAKKLSKKIVVKVTDKWLKSTSTVTLDVAGIESYQMLDDFKKVLMHMISGIKGVQVRRMVKTDAQIDVFLSGRTDLLAKELSQKTFKSFVVRIDEASANKLKVTLIKH